MFAVALMLAFSQASVARRFGRLLPPVAVVVARVLAMPIARGWLRP